MKKQLLLVSMFALAATFAGAAELFNGHDLTGWYKYIRGQGRNHDTNSVISVKNGVIHITGTEWGALVTEKEYSDYRLKLEYRWLGTRCGSKLNQAMDSGILFHSVGPDGGFGNCWLFSHEVNLIQGATGDFWTVSRRDRPDIALTVEVDEERQKCSHGEHYIWKRGGRRVTLTGNNRLCRYDIARDWQDSPSDRPAVNERPFGEWNEVELVCDGEKVEVFFNGKLVNAAVKAQPSRGKIQLQSEGCGIEFRNLTLVPLKK